MDDRVVSERANGTYYRQQGWWRNETVIDDLRRAVANHPDKIAIVSARRFPREFVRISYAELSAQVDRFAGALLELGCERNGVVAVQLPNGWQFTALALACARIGTIIAPIPPDYRRREVEFILRRTEASVYIGPAVWSGFSYQEMMRELAPTLLTLQKRVFVGAEGGLDSNELDFDAWFTARKWEERYKPAALDRLGAHPDDIFNVLYTSGTTGEPKGVLHSHNTNYAITRALADTLLLQSDDVISLPSILTASSGFTYLFLMPLLLGQTAIYMDIADPDFHLDLVEAHGVTFMYGLPTYFLNAIAAQRRKPRKVSSLKRIATGSIPVPPHLITEVREVFGVRLHTLWGMTENGAVTITRDDDPPDWPASSDGRPVRWMETKIVPTLAEDGTPFPDGTGRLMVRGASQCLGYFKREDIYAASVDAEGWFDTGDLARDDGRGGIRIVGRLKDMIFRYGAKIPVVEVESALYSHPKVREVAVVGHSDDRLGGERVCAVVTPHDSAPTLDELRQHLRALGMSISYWPDRLEIVEEMPKTPSGKIRKYLLRERLKQKPKKQPPLLPVSRDRPLPLSFAQQRLWFLAQLAPEDISYNVPYALRLKGQLDIDALERSLQALVERHEVLRTTFEEVEGTPAQRISAQLSVALPIEPLNDLAEEARKPFDLRTGPLFRAALQRVAADEHVLLLVMHHIVCDGWSMGVLVRDLRALYEAFARGVAPALPALTVQYADYASWQREWLKDEVLETQLAWWKNELAGAPTVLELPTDRPQGAARSTRGNRYTTRLSNDLSNAVRELSRAQSVTPYMTLLTAFYALLFRYSGQSDIVLGSPISARNRREVEGLIGFFVNTLALRVQVSAEASFRELLDRVKRTCMGGYAHQDLPFEKLVDALQLSRDLATTPLFQIVFVLQNVRPAALELPGLLLEVLDVPLDTSVFDLVLEMHETPNGLVACWHYRTDLLDESTIARMAEHYARLLEGAVSQPEKRLCDLPLLSAEERHRALVEWNDTRTEYPREACVHELFEEQVVRRPEAVAAEYESGVLTYSELNARANQVARHLRRLGVNSGARVGLCAAGSLEMVIGTLGILKAGAAYVPLDPAYPPERLAFMINDTGVSIVLAQPEFATRLPATSATALLLETFGEESGHNLGERVPPRATAYVMYTSGSTGQPKGVCITHQGIIRLVRNNNYFHPTDSDRIAQISNISFDAATWELWNALLSGARLVGVSKDIALSPVAFEAYLRERQVSALLVTTALFHQIAAERPGAFSTVGCVVTGGEALEARWAMRVRQNNGPKRLINAYGPTESTTIVTCYEVNEVSEPVASMPIGKPIANTEAYVLDPWLQPVPVGVVGELYAGGEGLATGYLNQPELTAERFVRHPFNSTPGACLYKTGDLVKYAADGNIHFVGRHDSQVKIRGFRVELGEIEASLAKHPDVNVAVVIARQEPLGEKRLVAYVVRREEGRTPELRAFLRETLPDYMVPSVFVTLHALPLTSNGKVDRKALPDPDAQAEEHYVAPRTAMEETVASVWSTLLRRARVGTHENFFEMGGHSLLAMQVASRLREAIHHEVPVRMLFEAPILSDLATRLESLLSLDGASQFESLVSADGASQRESLLSIEGASPLHSLRLADSASLLHSLRLADGTSPLDSLAPARGEPLLVPVSRNRDLPLSFAQQRLWFLEHLEPGGFAYNVPYALRLKGPLNVSALERSLQAIIDRHESLRTTFAEVDGTPVQRIASQCSVVLNLTDSDSTIEESQRPFNLTAGPLFRTTLRRVSPDEHVLLLVMHHIVCDGWSMGVFTRELETLYTAFSQGTEPTLPALPIQYADFAVWQREWLQGETLKAQLDYWKERLAGASEALDLPVDRPRPPIHSYNGTLLKARLRPELSNTIQQLERAEGVTPFMALLAAFYALLFRYTGQSDIVVGSPIAGRSRREVEGLIGFFVNTLALRVQVPGEVSFRELLGRVRETCLGAYAHQDLPFEQLVDAVQADRDPSRPPLFQVMFALQETPATSMEVLDVHPGMAKFALTLFVRKAHGEWLCFWEYNTDLFDESTVARMAEHYARLLEGAVSQPEKRLCDLPLLSASERHRALVDWNDTRTEYPREACVHSLFEEQVARRPEAVAAEYASGVLTYSELNARANQVARRLRRLGVNAGARVGLCAAGSLEMVIGTLGILKAGAAYVPLDPAYPSDRLAFMVEDTGVPIVLVQREFATRLPATSATALLLETFAEESEENLGETVPPQSVAYVMYTSGSTGQPKGVCVPHQAIIRLVRNSNYFQPTEKDRIAQLSNISFDAATWELWNALLTGARLVGVPKDIALSPSAFEALLREKQVSALCVTTALFHQIAAERPGAFSTVDFVITGGEALETRWAMRIRQNNGPRKLLNGYGPTESTTFATTYEVEAVAEHVNPVPLGKPIANTETYVLDPWLQPVPVGVVGELYVGGDGLATGYLNQPELTTEKFITHPFSPKPGARLYRTGDLVKTVSDGTIHFVGRRDSQVKVRGFRVELSEVEAAVAKHPDVNGVVVIAREEGLGGKRLVAYVVPRQEGQTLELRAFLRETLPEYMLPSAFVMLRALPITANGKVDRAALPAPETQADENYVAPRTAMEEMVAKVWAVLLGQTRVGAQQNFFELGGHSLLAMQVVSRLRAALHREVPVRVIFEAPVLSDLAKRLESLLLVDGVSQLQSLLSADGASQLQSLLAGDGASQLQSLLAADGASQLQSLVSADGVTQLESLMPTGSELPLTPVPRDKDLPLSFAQQRLWFLEQLEPGGFAYNVPYALRLTGRLDAIALERSLQALVERHEALRTTFLEVGGEPVQRVAQQMPLTMQTLSVEERAIQQKVEEEARRPFDLEQGPLVRATLWRLAPEEHVLLLVMHHIVCDIWSLTVLARELEALYSAFSQGAQPALPPLPIQYADYATWQRTELHGAALEAQLNWWKEQLAGAPPTLDLPVDHPRPPLQAFRGAHLELPLPTKLATAIHELSRKESVTPFMTFLAAFQALLVRYTGQSDVIVGSPIVGRNRVEVEGLIGCFLNTLALRVDIPEDASFKDLLSRVRETCLGAYAHQDLPYEQLVETLQPVRDPSRTPLFQVMFAHQTAFPVVGLPGVSIKLFDFEPGMAKFDLTLFARETADGLVSIWEYNTDVFDEATIQRMAAYYAKLLAGAVADPQRRLSELPLLCEDERQRVLVDWNATTVPYPSARSVHALFEASVQRAPDAVAVKFGSEQLTYRELNRKANQLAHHLRARGVTVDEPVGLCVQRSFDLVIGMLGILKAGGAYVPLDPAYPQERLTLMLESSGARVLLTQSSLADALTAGRATPLLLDSGASAWAEESDLNPDAITDPDSLAYIIYTSGSTGVPKGIAMPHRPLINLIHWQIDHSHQPRGRTLQFSALSFDVSFQEMFSTWTAGGELVLVSEETRRDAGALLELLKRDRIERMYLPLIALQHLAEAADQEEQVPQDLKELITGGEQLKISPALRRFMKRLGHCVLQNHYGPSETHVATAYTLAGDPDTWPDVPSVGQPISNTSLYLLDRHLQPVPIGVPGELYIGGAGVARGYHRRADLTDERFIPDTVGAVAGTVSAGRLYRTGDFGRFLPDGNVEFLGRRDTQVKVRGYRIEPTEVEAVLAHHPAVKDCVVEARGDARGQKRLIAYVTGSEVPTAHELRDFLKARLPEYMVPSAFVRLDALPLTPSGKVARKALPAPEESSRDERQSIVGPRNALELQLASIWEDVLGIHPIGVQDNFFELGGHSLLAIRLLARIRSGMGHKLSVSTLFQHPTVESLARVLHRDAGPWSPLVELRGGSAKRPFFCVHAVGGTVMSYAELARWLGPDQPFYGLQSRGAEEGQAPLDSIEAMAEFYIEAVRAIQPHGPYRLGGWSMGGAVAFEMAQQLQRAGEEVDVLALIDSFARLIAEEPSAAQLAVLFHQDLLRAAGHVSPPFQTVEEADRSAASALGIGLQTLQALRRVFEANLRALWQYTPRAYNGSLISFEAADSQRDHGWQEFVSGHVVTHRLDGDHYSILRGPGAEALAAQLRTHLDSL